MSGSIVYVGIRREDKSIWERRATLIPEHASEIMKNYPNIKFIVQPCNRRIFTDYEYEKAGAIISEDLSKCVLILGVKEIPIQLYKPNTTYMNFAHIIKAQEANMYIILFILKNITIF